MKNLIRGIMIHLGIFSVWVHPLWATVYTVQINGGGDFLSIQACLNSTQLNPGDTCLVGQGTYSEIVKPSKSGTYENPIVISAVPNQIVRIQAIDLDAVDYVFIERLQTRSITQYEVTWTFDSYYECGLFANEDFWVKGPVTITSMTPDWNQVHNGWEVNPLPRGDQPYDAGGYMFNGTSVPTLPYVAQPGSSIVKGVSFDQNPNSVSQPGTGAFSQCYSTPNTTCLKTAAVLTVVGSTPPDGGKTVFRPPYTGTAKPYYSITNLQTHLLPNYAPVANTPSLLSQDFLNMRRVQLDHFMGISDRTARPKLNLPNYGGSIGTLNNVTGLRLLLNDPLSQKWPLLIAFIQGGIDRYHMAALGQTWPPGGGYELGEKTNIIYAGILLNDSAIKNFAGSGVRIADEDTVFKLTTRDGKPLYGDDHGNTYLYVGQYWEWVLKDYGYNDGGGDPYGFIDGGMNTTRVHSSYQTGIVSPGLKGSAIATLLLPGGKEVWNNPKIFDYADRWVTSGLHTQPDACAPPVGQCQGGSNPGAVCTTQTEILSLNPNGAGYFFVNGSNSACLGGGTCNFSDDPIKQANLGITYGQVAGASGKECILDPNLTPGSTMNNFSCQPGKVCGRFPKRHNALPDWAYGYGSSFTNAMWNAYRNSVGQPLPTSRVATPSLSPYGGTFQESVSVSLACVTPGSEIRFTLDGTEPNNSSPLYQINTPLVITKTTLVKAKAFKSGIPDSAVVTASFVITDKGNANSLTPSLAFKKFKTTFTPKSDSVMRIQFSATADPFSLSVADRHGNVVRTINNGVFDIDGYTYLWDGTNNNGEKVSSGSYILVLKQGNKVEKKKIVVVK